MATASDFTESPAADEIQAERDEREVRSSSGLDLAGYQYWDHIDAAPSPGAVDVVGSRTFDIRHLAWSASRLTAGEMTVSPKDNFVSIEISDGHVRVSYDAGGDVQSILLRSPNLSTATSSRASFTIGARQLRLLNSLRANGSDPTGGASFPDDWVDVSIDRLHGVAAFDWTTISKWKNARVQLKIGQPKDAFRGGELPIVASMTAQDLVRAAAFVDVLTRRDPDPVVTLGQEATYSSGLASASTHIRSYEGPSAHIRASTLRRAASLFRWSQGVVTVSTDGERCTLRGDSREVRWNHIDEAAWSIPPLDVIAEMEIDDDEAHGHGPSLSVLEVLAIVDAKSENLAQVTFEPAPTGSDPARGVVHVTASELQRMLGTSARNNDKLPPRLRPVLGRYEARLKLPGKLISPLLTHEPLVVGIGVLVRARRLVGSPLRLAAVRHGRLTLLRLRPALEDSPTVYLTTNWSGTRARLTPLRTRPLLAGK